MKFGVCAALATALAITCNAHATDLRQLTQETQRMSTQDGQLTMVWWFPQAFWEASMDASSTVTPEGKAQVLKALGDYMIFGLVHVRMSGAGLTDPSPKEDLLKNATLEIGGKTVEPVAPENLSVEAAAILAGFKPGLARTAGQVGQSMEIVAYPAKRDGKPLLDPGASGAFKFLLYGQVFTWHLPLASLLPLKFDPRTHEQFPGNYQFNPYTGGRLDSKP